MANKQRGEISFEANGQTWTMKVGTHAMCEIEDATGKTIAEIGNLMGNTKTASMKLLRAVFWGSLQHHHEGISMKDAADLIDEIGADVAGQKIGEAFSIAFPKSKGGETRPRVAAAA